MSDTTAGTVSRNTTTSRPGATERHEDAAEPSLEIYTRPLARIAAGLPWLLLLFAIASLVAFPVDIMFLTGLLAAAIASVLLMGLGQAVPEGLARVRQRELLLAPGTRRAATPAEFARFLQQFHGGLNHPTRFVLALFFTVAAVPQFFLAATPSDALELVRASGFAGLITIFSGWPVVRLVGIALTAIVGFILGLFAWRMTCVGVYIYRLGSAFDTRVQSRHPDGAGGLGPLGTVCFMNALIVIVPSIFLGVWRTLIASVPAYHVRYGYLQEWFDVLLLVTVLLTIVSFFAPLYGVHRAMAREKAARQPELDAISTEMDELTRAMREAAGVGNTDEVNTLKAKHGVLGDVYVREREIPVWPVDVTVLRTYLVSQVVPLLSLSKISEFVTTRLFGSS